jgi:hypothetical protein
MATLKQQLEDLKVQNSHLRKQNLIMRLEFEVLLDFPDGTAAQKIKRKYRRKRQIREEALLSLQN